jgi:hypothetical protein
MPVGSIGVSSNQGDFERALDAFVGNLALAASRSANELRDQAETAGLREIASDYGIGPRTFEKYVNVTIATPGRLEASVIARGKGFPLYVFEPHQTRQGVSVLVKGKRTLILHAFIATMPNGHVGIFARGAYGERFHFKRGVHKRRPLGRNTELPIAELYTWAPSDALGNPTTVAAMNDRVDEQRSKVIQRNVRFAVSGQ